MKAAKKFNFWDTIWAYLTIVLAPPLLVGLFIYIGVLINRYMPAVCFLAIPLGLFLLAVFFLSGVWKLFGIFWIEVYPRACKVVYLRIAELFTKNSKKEQNS